jgi:hypothetical protein
MRQIRRHPEPNDNFVPVVSLRSRLDDLAYRYKWSPQHGADDLDEYDEVLVEYGRGKKFLLHRYAGSPEMVDLYIPARMPDYKSFLEDIVAALQIARSDVIERQFAYEGF